MPKSEGKVQSETLTFGHDCIEYFNRGKRIGVNASESTTYKKVGEERRERQRSSNATLLGDRTGEHDECAKGWVVRASAVQRNGSKVRNPVRTTKAARRDSEKERQSLLRDEGYGRQRGTREEKAKRETATAAKGRRGRRRRRRKRRRGEVGGGRCRQMKREVV
ncbi:uncharacterized protein CIMG_11762 [Coccidioides immitis RS]|uniref:Uncharacterized protein n=1 Tax=Coccidioides immitis (strain RS) TaxID=246410 RepID=A0A0D8JUF4_COCIM|nr:uncharacterized protein CIMG_11762 [Coccidioides immitis RS]KJF60586.1 hypothetical protein CIMG_11762 [Coccidioides immitis RS]